MINKEIDEMRHLTDEMSKAISTEYKKRVLADERKLEAVLKENGWRKASEVAREIFDEIDNLLLITIGIIDESLDNAVRENNFVVASVMSNNRSLVDTLRTAISVRKKKYTEGEE